MEKVKMKKKNKIIIAVSVILVVLCALGAAYKLLWSEEKISVETVSASKQTINETLDTTGTLASESEQIFSIPDGVKVLSVGVDEGDNVGAGQTIATFDAQSLLDFVDQKETEYETAQAAYKDALNKAGNADGKTSDIKAQIAELEEKIASYKAKSGNTQAKSEEKTEEAPKDDGVKLSSTLVNRFIKIAKLMGVEYTYDEAEKVLKNTIKAGNSLSDVSNLVDQLGTISSMGSFNMSNFDMTELASVSSMGTEAIQAELTLAQLKAQLTGLEIQSNDSYLNAYKLVAQKAQEAYSKAKSDYDNLKDGWKSNNSGIVVEVNIKDGSTSSAVKDSVSGSDVSLGSILSAISSGSDVTSMVSSFFGSRPTAIKILNYPLVANISLNKYDINDVSVNQKATVKSANGQVFDAKVSYISPTASSSGAGIDLNSIMGNGASSNSIPAQITIDSTSRALIVGVDVDVSIITDTVENAVVVPVEAICIDGSDVFVYTYDKETSRAVKKNVTLGISNDTYYQVTAGIESGDVLLKNTSGLDDGAKVEVKAS